MTPLDQALKTATLYRDMILILIVIMLSGIIVSLALYMKIGREGRFMVFENIFRGGGAIGIFRKSSGQAIFRHLKAKGRSLIHGKSGFAFLPTIRTLISARQIELVKEIEINEDKLPDETEEDRKKRVAEQAQKKEDMIKELEKRLEDHPRMNKLIETQTIMCNKPLVTGSVAAALAATPSLNEALAVARQREYLDVVALLEHLKEVYAGNPGLKEISLIQPWTVNQLQEFVNLSYTDGDIDETYQEGYIKGLSSYETYNKLLLVALAILFIAFIGVVFWLTK